MSPDLGQRRPRWLAGPERVGDGPPGEALPGDAHHPRGAPAIEERVGDGTAGKHDQQGARDQRGGEEESLTPPQPEKAHAPLPAPGQRRR